MLVKYVTSSMCEASSMPTTARNANWGHTPDWTGIWRIVLSRGGKLENQVNNPQTRDKNQDQTYKLSQPCKIKEVYDLYNV